MLRAHFFLALLLVTACSGPPARAGTTPPATSTASAAARVTLSPTVAPTPTATAAVRYVAIGASDTVGVGATDPVSGSWPARVATLLPPGSAFVNVGVSGSIALQARTAQLPGALAQRPTVVSIWLAVNDMNATIEPASFANDLGAIVDALVSGTDAKIFVGNVPDVRPVPAYQDADKAALFRLIGAYNAAIAGVGAKYPGRVFVVDLFTGSADLVSTMTVSGDGFHPSDAGYQLIADRFAAAMRANGVPLR
ncbi:MAG TPA: GDSL-type esterase/lipase family protein [Candidatus Limnocylindria bacterium]|nr:GDSL-type esterase/lipase family protein [Candidatus Limnocylindria bacterium]